jgi:hypothetical protein
MLSDTLVFRSGETAEVDLTPRGDTVFLSCEDEERDLAVLSLQPEEAEALAGRLLACAMMAKRNRSKI